MNLKKTMCAEILGLEERIKPYNASKTTWYLHLSRYLFACKELLKERATSGYVADIACGTGYGTLLLALLGGYYVIGGDLSINAIMDAKVLIKRRENIELLVLDAIYLPFRRNSFLYVVSFETIEHISKFKDFLNEVKSVLKRNGTFICSTPNRDFSLLRNPYHISELSLLDFMRLLYLNFEHATIYGQLSMTLIRKVNLLALNFLYKILLLLSLVVLTKILSFKRVLSKILLNKLRLRHFTSLDSALLHKYSPNRLYENIFRYLIGIAKKPVKTL